MFSGPSVRLIRCRAAWRCRRCLEKRKKSSNLAISTPGNSTITSAPTSSDTDLSGLAKTSSHLQTAGAFYRPNRNIHSNYPKQAHADMHKSSPNRSTGNGNQSLKTHPNGLDSDGKLRVVCRYLTNDMAEDGTEGSVSMEFSSKSSTNNGISPTQVEAGERSGFISNNRDPGLTNGAGQHAEDEIVREKSSAKVDRPSIPTFRPPPLENLVNWQPHEITRLQPPVTGNAMEAGIGEVGKIRPSYQSQPNQPPRGELPPLRISSHIQANSPQSANTDDTPRPWPPKPVDCRVCKRKILMDSAKAVNGILCKKCREEQASPVRSANRDSVGLSEGSSPMSNGVGVENSNVTPTLPRSSTHNQPLAMDTTHFPTAPPPAIGRSETAGIVGQKPQTSKKLPTGLRNPGNKPSEREYRYQYSGGSRRSSVNVEILGYSATAGASNATAMQPAENAPENLTEAQPPEHTSPLRRFGPPLPLDGIPFNNSRQPSLASQRTSVPRSSGEATPGATSGNRPSESAQSLYSTSKDNAQSTSVSTAISSRTSTASPVRPTSQTPRTRENLRSQHVEWEIMSVETVASLSNRLNQTSRKGESPKKGATAASRVSESQASVAVSTGKQTNGHLTNPDPTNPQTQAEGIARSTLSPFSGKGMKSVPLPTVEPKEVVVSQISTSRSHSERTRDRSPTPMDTEMIDVEPGAADHNESSADEKVKLDKPALTWKELISLGLCRNKRGVGMTSNEVVDWIQKNVPGYRGEPIKGSVAAVLSKYGQPQESNGIFHKTLNPNEGPKWVWSLVHNYRDFIDVEKVEETYAAALSNSTPRRRRPTSTGISTISPSAKRAETRVRRADSTSIPAKHGDPHFRTRRSARELSNADNEPSNDESSEAQVRGPVRESPLVSRKQGAPFRRIAMKRAVSSGDEEEQEAARTPSKVKQPTLPKTTVPASEDENEALGVRRSGRATSATNLLSQNRERYLVQEQSQSANIFSTRSGRQIKPTLKSTVANRPPDREVAPDASDINLDGPECGYFSDVEARGSQPAKDLGPAAVSVEAFLSEAFGHLEAEDAKQNARELPLFKQYNEDPLYGGKVEYNVKDLFAMRPDKDIEQNGAFFDREAKKQEISQRPKRSDLRRFRKDNAGESVPYLRTIRASRNPKFPFVEKDRSGKLWDDDDDDKYANSDEDFEGNVATLCDEDGVRKYKNMKELLEMPSEPELALDKDDKLVFREPKAIGANGRVRRRRQEWKVACPKGI